MTLNFGKFKGRPIETVPFDYLTWLWASCKDTVDMVEEELNRRTGRVDYAPPKRDASINDPLYLEMLDAGYKALATKLHPDKGGSTPEMQKLNELREKLLELFSA